MNNNDHFIFIPRGGGIKENEKRAIFISSLSKDSLKL